MRGKFILINYTIEVPKYGGMRNIVFGGYKNTKVPMKVITYIYHEKDTYVNEFHMTKVLMGGKTQVILSYDWWQFKMVNIPFAMLLSGII